MKRSREEVLMAVERLRAVDAVNYASEIQLLKEYAETIPSTSTRHSWSRQPSMMHQCVWDITCRDCQVEQDERNRDAVCPVRAQRYPTPTKPDVPPVEYALRVLLAHQVAGMKVYVDDGELQDSTYYPSIDFLRDSPATIQQKLHERATKQGN